MTNINKSVDGTVWHVLIEIQHTFFVGQCIMWLFVLIPWLTVSCKKIKCQANMLRPSSAIFNYVIIDYRHSSMFMFSSFALFIFTSTIRQKYFSFVRFCFDQIVPLFIYYIMVEWINVVINKQCHSFMNHCQSAWWLLTCTTCQGDSFIIHVNVEKDRIGEGVRREVNTHTNCRICLTNSLWEV